MFPNVPKLPDEVLALAEDVLAELTDFAHVQREHAKRTCYTAGCQGPLCSRAERLYKRDRYQKQRKAAGKPYQPNDLRRDERDDELDNALAVYTEHRKTIEIVVRIADLYKDLEKSGK